MTNLKDAIRAAAEEKGRQENHNTGIPESGKASLSEMQKAIIQEPEEMANLTIKVSKRQRRHWLIEAKKQDTSLTAAIVEALNARFGQPETL